MQCGSGSPHCPCSQNKPSGHSVCATVVELPSQIICCTVSLSTQTSICLWVVSPCDTNTVASGNACCGLGSEQYLASTQIPSLQISPLGQEVVELLLYPSRCLQLACRITWSSIHRSLLISSPKPF